jgi:hypothetical protein
VGEGPLAGLGVSFGELALPLVELLEYFVEIVYGPPSRAHTSMWTHLPLRPAIILSYSPECVEGDSLLKKSLSDRSIGRNGIEMRAEHGINAANARR